VLIGAAAIILVQKASAIDMNKLFNY